MKGVIVQIGEPKSIVLFNNGKIGAIPTPANCHVGMVVTVKYNNLLKIMIIACAAALLLALGVFIGATYWGRNTAQYDPWRGRRGHMMEQFHGPENMPPPEGQWCGERGRMWRGGQGRMWRNS